MERYVEASDCIVCQLTGRERRSACAAGYRAMWEPQQGFPEAFLAAVDMVEANARTVAIALGLRELHELPAQDVARQRQVYLHEYGQAPDARPRVIRRP